MSLQMIKVIATVLTAMVLGISSVQADNFSQTQEDLIAKRRLDDSINVIKKSKALRKYLSANRTIAGMTISDERWIQEFNAMMADNKTDYLKKAYQLKD